MIRNSKRLVKNPMLVALVANQEIGLQAAKHRTRFAATERELSAEYLGRLTGLSKPTVIAAIAEAVKLGFFERTDSGKGGPHGKNRATYQATIPVYP